MKTGVQEGKEGGHRPFEDRGPGGASRAGRMGRAAEAGTFPGRKAPGATEEPGRHVRWEPGRA